MNFNVETFWLPKEGCSAAEYEDAFDLSDITRSSQLPLRFAVADGATDSSFSGIWARLLAKAFVERSHESDDIEQILARVQPQWEQEVGQRPLPWYAEEKVRAGAFSALLGLTIAENVGTGRSEWRAMAVGDSCLVQVRSEKAIVKFPIDHSSGFNAMPFLLATTASFNSKLREHLAFADGEIQPDDTLYLMTDALACWFMAADEQGLAPWVALQNLSTRDQFAEMIKGFRSRHEMRNDDCTLMRIAISFG